MDERITQYFEGKLSAEERKRLLQEIQEDVSLKSKMIAYQNLYACLFLHPGTTDPKEGRVEYRRMIRQKRKEKQARILKMSMQYAAAFVLIFSLGWLTSVRFQEKDVSPILSGDQEFYIPPGQRGKITLPDGSHVWLNAGSTLSYSAVFEGERGVSLRGEAWFDVAKNDDLPFIVYTDQVNIHALGTQFNVYAYDAAGYVMTSLLSGKIKVSDKSGKNEVFLINENEQAIYDNHRFEVSPIRDKDLLLWRDGIYSFRNEPMESILKKLEIYYDTQIVVKDPQILKFEYTGKFRQLDGVMEILRLIQLIHPFHIHRDEENNRITLSK